jgi:hypothetical protein
VEGLRVIVEDNRAEVNFELIERLAEPEERDRDLLWPFHLEREKKLAVGLEPTHSTRSRRTGTFVR